MQTAENRKSTIPFPFRSGSDPVVKNELNNNEKLQRFVRYLLGVRKAGLIEEDVFEKLLKMATTNYIQTEVRQLVDLTIKIKPRDYFSGSYLNV